MRSHRVGLVTGLLIAALSGCGGNRGIVVVEYVAGAPYEKVGRLSAEDMERLTELRISTRRARQRPEPAPLPPDAAQLTVAQYLARYPDANRAAAEASVVRVDDRLDITIHDTPELSRANLCVAPDGTLALPLLGSLPAAGLTLTQLQQRISHELALGRFVLDAQVTVAFSDPQARCIYVEGAVYAAGVFPLTRRQRVGDALTQAGGIDLDRAGGQVLVVRGGGPTGDRHSPVVIQIDREVFRGPMVASGDLILHDKDRVYVPAARRFHILGEVREPGTYPVGIGERFLLEAIRMAGGFTPLADRNRTRIIRLDKKGETHIRLKAGKMIKTGRMELDIPLQAGDIIVVPEAFF